ncbi:MAG: hypothetical protein ACI8R4_000598 [Paracoccaceae bacterium]|jgi:hypothetical protein
MTHFTADRAAYLRSHAWLAALGMAGAMALLWLAGNPHVWTGAVAGLGAVVVRGWYLASEEFAVVWEIKDQALIGPAERKIPLNQIDKVRSMGSFVQVITRSGDKHLIKYQADPAATITAIERARL